MPDVSLQRREVIDRAACARGVADAFRAASAPLRRLVAFDAAIWLATDPATSLPVAPTRAENLDAFRRRGACVRLWELEFGFADVNLYAQLGRSPTPAAGLRAATGDHPARSARFRELLQPAGFGDELRAVLRVDGEPWGALALMRGEDVPPFDTRDAALVAGLSRPLARAVRDHAARGARATAGDGRGPGLLLFDADGRLASINDDARAWLDELDDDGRSDAAFGVPLPLVVVSTLAQARAIAAERDDRRARVRMRSRTGEWLVCHASSLREPDGRLGATAVVIEPAPASEIAPLLSAAYGLSARELEITGLIARGASTADIAAALQLSRHTVRDHVKTVFGKVGVSSRGELVARLYAEHAAPLHAAGEATPLRTTW